MKKYFAILIIIGIFVAMPLSSNADIITPVNMKLSVSSPIGNVTLPGYSGGVYH